MCKYDEDYFERGIETGLSCYQNYRWLPEFTMSMAMSMIDSLGIKQSHTILDFGCAKGFLVKAFRLLHRQAFGVDLSSYAIRNLDPCVRDFCCLNTIHNPILKRKFDFCIAKDVLEHIPEKCLEAELSEIQSETMLAIIPLGHNGKYFAPANDLDKTHVVCENKDWWVNKFASLGFELIAFTNQIPGIKESYYEAYPESFGFFILGHV